MKKTYLLLIIGFLLFPTFVYADVCSDYKATLEGGKVTINAISPTKASALIDENEPLHISAKNYLQQISSNLYSVPAIPKAYTNGVQFNSDYTKLDVYLKEDGSLSNTPSAGNMASYEGTKCTIDVTWAEYDNTKATAVLNYIKSVPSSTYTDMRLLNHYKRDFSKDSTTNIISEKFPNLDAKLVEHITYAQPMDDQNCSKQEYVVAYCNGYVSALEQDEINSQTIIKTCNNILKTYEHKVRTNLCGDKTYIQVIYDGVLYYFLPNSRFYTYPVFYIPEFTKNDVNSYLEAARERASKVLGSTSLLYINTTGDEDDEVVKYRKNLINFGYSHELIDQTLNSTFEPLFVEMKIEGGQPLYVVLAKAPEDKLLSTSNEVYDKYYQEQKTEYESVIAIPDTLSFSPKSIIIIGFISLLIGLGIIYKVTKKTA